MTDRDGKPRPWTLNDRPHWAKRRANSAQIYSEVGWRVRQQRIPRQAHVTVQLHYAPGDNRRRDVDNLVASAKAAVDAIVRAGVVVDDRPEFVTHLMPAIHGGRCERRLWLVVETTPRPEPEETPK
jgi:crossover junction endodeoxyribonuclease RusA